jgi:hypothetical protein
MWSEISKFGNVLLLLGRKAKTAITKKIKRTLTPIRQEFRGY